MSLLPSLDLPRIDRINSGAVARTVDTLDALLVMVPETANARTLSALPQSERWQKLHARERPQAGSVRTTALANQRQTLAVLGYLRSGASPFEMLSLAGRMVKEAGSRRAETLGLAVLPGSASAVLSLDALLAAALTQSFALPAFRSTRAEERKTRRIVLVDGAAVDLNRAEAAARGNNLARWLTALPPNKLDARGYRRIITELAGTHGLALRWLDERALARLGANAFLAVSAGNSERVAGIAHLKYRPARGRKSASRANGAVDLALIGKGILFDTGGVNLKPHRSMLDMHTDMAGSAVALATICALAELRAPFTADAWLAITENQIGPRAYRPQEVVRASNGVTIQVIHTDAEGRMVLADTLAIAGRTRPRFMLDFATLTGACVYALTERMSGIFTNRPEIVPKLMEAGRSSGERVWHFPLDADYDSDIESKVADVLQCAVEGKGDHIHAARFLSRFIPEESAWAHVDLASATRSGGLAHINTDVTGFGVRYALELILEQQILAGLERKERK